MEREAAKWIKPGSTVATWAEENPMLAAKAIRMRKKGCNMREIHTELRPPFGYTMLKYWLNHECGSDVEKTYRSNWTPDEDRTLTAAYRSGVPVGAIAKALGRSNKAIQNRRSRLGLPDRSATPLGPTSRADRQLTNPFKGEEAVQRKAAQKHLEAIEAEGLGCFPFYCEGEPRLVNARIGSKIVRARHYPLEEVTW